MGHNLGEVAESKNFKFSSFSSNLIYALGLWANFLVPCILKLKGKLGALMRVIVLLVFWMQMKF